MATRRTLLPGLCALTVFALSRPGRAQSPAPAVPQNATDAIFKAFESHRLVALNEGNHGNEQGAAFRLSLLRDPRFLAVDDVVAECGASQEQATIDRFMAGENVPDRELRKVWQDTTQAHAVWDVPIYQAFFRAAREVNANRPESLPPLTPPPGAAGAVPMRMMLPAGSQGSIVSLLEQGGEKMFVIWTVTGTDLTALQPDTARWAPPSLALIRGTPLGLAPLSAYSPPGQTMSFGVLPGGVMKTAQPLARPGAMQDVVDAILYLGPPSSITYSKLTRELCADPAYVEMRTRRMASRPNPMGGDSAAEFRSACASVVSPP